MPVLVFLFQVEVVEGGDTTAVLQALFHVARAKQQLQRVPAGDLTGLHEIHEQVRGPCVLGVTPGVERF